MRAQTLTSYYCDFEDPAEIAQWAMNVGTKATGCNNHWYVGAAGSFGIGSNNGLYVSNKNGDTSISTYSTAQSEYVTSYRELTLAAGTYTLRYDWQCLGDSADGVYIFWVDNASTNTNSNYDRSRNLTKPAYLPAGTVLNRGRQLWQSATTTFVSSGNTGKLVIVWFNIRNRVYAPAAAIDNIEIYQGTCATPTNVHYDGNSSSLTWSGNAGSYEVIVYNTHSGTRTDYPSVTSNSLQLGDMSEEGMYNFYVRSACGEHCHSKWVFTNTFVWIAGARCIDIFDLTKDNSGAAKCYWTDHDAYGSSGGYDPYLYDHAGQVDYGADNELSRHTIHYQQGEKDPRTNNQLSTIPDGEIASIRVNGFWDSKGDHASTIEYEYPVQAGVSDLLELKFACVLQNPSHSESEQPRFKLDVLMGNTVVNACAQTDFKAGFGDASAWHVVDPESYNRVDWCDWQTVTVSLRDYIGSTLKIRLTAYDCTLSGHYGYAYFTMNCKGGDLQGIACGDFSTDHFEAPEGFQYRWYRADDPNKTVLSTDRIYNITNNDPTVYLVDMIDPNKRQCYYTLEANPNPRFPQAKASARVKGEDCMNKVDFTQECSVVRINRQTLDSVKTDELVEEVIWDFGDGSAPLNTLDANVHHDYPPEGGEYDVKITAKMSGGICADTYTLHLSLPNLIPADDVQYTHYCEPGEDYTDTTYATAPTGCEQRKLHHHRHHLPFDTLYTDRFCEGGRYFFPGTGRYYTQSIDTTVNLKSVYGCDSTIRLSLIVDPKLMVEYPSALEICYDDRVISIPYTVTSGALDSVHVYFSAEAQKYGFEPVYAFGRKDQVVIAVPKNARPDRYPVQLDFSSERCAMPIQTVEMTLMYSASVVMQTGGFIGVQNANYNGGYNFTAFDWYKDGVQLNHHASYIPAGPDDFGSTYVIYLTREGETQPLQTCPIVYNPYAQDVDLVADGPSVWPTCVSGGAELHLAPQACTIYTILGTVVAHYPQALETRTIAAPSQAGVYVVVFDNKKSSRILVR